MSQQVFYHVGTAAIAATTTTARASLSSTTANGTNVQIYNDGDATQ